MIIDSSAVLAVALEEPEGPRIAAVIGKSNDRRMSSVNLLETMMVLEGRLGSAKADELLFLMLKLEYEFVPFDLSQMRAAQAAWRRFGKGNHPAKLNMADCCAYALAATSGEPLLFKGNDFAQTDVATVTW